MRLVQNDATAAAGVKAVLGVVLSPPFIGFCVQDGGKVKGVVVINDYTGANAEMTGVGRGCWTPHVIRELARYVFRQLGCRRLTARTATSNRQAARALERLGFKREGIARQWFDGEDAILFGLLADEQRLIR